MPPKLHGGVPCLSSPTETASTLHASCPDLQGNTKRWIFRLAHAITCMLRPVLLCPRSTPVVRNRWKPFRRKACGCLSPSSSRDAFSLGILLCRVIAVTVPSHCLSYFQFYQFYSRSTSLSRIILRNRIVMNASKHIVQPAFLTTGKYNTQKQGRNIHNENESSSSHHLIHQC